MSSVSLVLLFTCNAILIGLPLAEGTCSSNSDCPGKFFNNVCCGRSWYGGRRCVTDSCVGYSCSTHGDCGGKDECCISNKCTKNGCVECHSNSYCASSEYCCKHQYLNDHNVCRRSCVGETCHSSSDCGGPTEYCDSDKKCREECTSNSDCDSSEYCASNKKCREERCTSNSDCNSSDYCCKRGTLTNVCRTSCVGETCLSSYDCGGSSELCSSNKICYKCVTAGCSACTSDSDCGSSEYCCKRGDLTNVCRTSCVGETCHWSVDCGGSTEYCASNKKCRKQCTSNSDCDSSKYCCRGRCKGDCVGVTCFYDADCGGPGEVCHLPSTSCTVPLAGWVIPVICVGVVLFVILVGIIWAYRRRRRRSSRRAVVVVRGRPARRATAIIALRETKIRSTHSAPVYNSPPPPYYNLGQDFPPPQTHQLPPQPQHGMPPPQPQHFPQPQPLHFPSY